MIQVNQIGECDTNLKNEVITIAIDKVNTTSRS